MITNQKQEHITAGHFLVFLVQTGSNLAIRSRLMEQELFAVRRKTQAFSGHVNRDSSVWEVTKNSKPAFVALERGAAGIRSLLDPV